MIAPKRMFLHMHIDEGQAIAITGERMCMGRDEPQKRGNKVGTLNNIRREIETHKQDGERPWRILPGESCSWLSIYFSSLLANHGPVSVACSSFFCHPSRPLLLLLLFLSNPLSYRMDLIPGTFTRSPPLLSQDGSPHRPDPESSFFQSLSSAFLEPLSSLFLSLSLSFTLPLNIHSQPWA